MLHVWDAPLARATKDLDLLGQLDNALENLESVIREVCVADVEPDGMAFDPASVETERIKEDADYEGVRVRFVGLLGKARVPMQIDVGFDDVVTPGAHDITYPTLLDFPALHERDSSMLIDAWRGWGARWRDLYDPERPRATPSAPSRSPTALRSAAVYASLRHPGRTQRARVPPGRRPRHARPRHQARSI